MSRVKELEHAIKILAEYLPEQYALVTVAGGIGLFDLSKPLALQNILAGGHDNVAKKLLRFREEA